ncbi:phosphate/phosphite/phosphonate ABC transporter substrate-binding protein [Kosakonia pseudosacchari]|uniref:phosphate/phosphite/phosphonate ABC transporter substrate-binding protein n=1 Tax=Kosakonia pseudosacchari TaxID=1646340 RepID=UPI00187F766E|nr:PhnD/SsuA/transferrin family substrate-binding protein [Kosakonia pseudosacchari]QOV65172.1 PhnD/SsuA/transferrin family substrate-binding protein [Kosakonia pseudosacchari]
MHTPPAKYAVNNIALPMYNIAQPETAALGEALCELLAARGLPAQQMWPQSDLLAHWQGDDVLLSQTCGYPLMTQLPDVQLVGCFHYLAPGCEGFCYRSLLVTRDEERGTSLADFRGRRAVCNSADSQSGYNVLRYLVSRLPGEGRFFAEAPQFSGSHRQSLLALHNRTADIAAIDCVTYALLQRLQPSLLRGLRVVAQSPLAPGLPLITAQQSSAATLASLREALQQLVSDARFHKTCAAALIGGFSVVTRQDYSLLLRWRDEAAARGVTQL